MALKILSGIVSVRQDEACVRAGRMVIDLNTHEVGPESAGQLVERRATGPTGRYVSEPIRHVALRQFRARLGAAAGEDDADDGLWIELGDTVDRDALRIDWATRNLHPTGFRFEIAYLVMGEAEGPA